MNPYSKTNARTEGPRPPWWQRLREWLRRLFRR
jgi:hypothetical protein